jgi:hypothetical protein
MSTYELCTLVIRVLATLFAAVIAIMSIWGESLRFKLTPAALRIRLRDEKGQLAHQDEGNSRYYHLVVDNPRKWVLAKNVVVDLMRIDRPGREGWITSYSTGPIPLVWQYGSFNKGPSDIGRDRYCDLGRLRENGNSFGICTQFVPQGFNGSIRPGEKMRAHFVAHADNATSNTIVIEFDWDGKWDDDNERMANHLSVRLAQDSETRNRT